MDGSRKMMQPVSMERQFGEPFVHVKDNGNLAIARDVLDAFRELTAETVVWDRSEKAWRLRAPKDPAGRLAE
jgi:hypothetical protein